MTSTHDTDMTTSADPDRDETSERLDADYPAGGRPAADDQFADQAAADQDGEHDGPPFAVGQNGTVTPGTTVDDGDETLGSAGTDRSVSDTDPDLIIVAETVDEVPAVTDDSVMSDSVMSDSVMSDSVRDDGVTDDSVTDDSVTDDSVTDDPAAGNLATSQTGPDQTAAATGTGTGTAATPGPADRAAQAQDYDRRWSELQALFVDDPRASVEQAARLVDDEIEALVQAARQQQESLSTWRAADADTEALRNALRSYRTFWGTVHEELARQS
jgi:hypothetical protein